MRSTNVSNRRGWVFIISSVLAIGAVVLLGLGLLIFVVMRSGFVVVGAPATPSTQPTQVLHWDWTKKHTTKETNWPTNVHDTIWFIEQRTEIIIDLPDGRQVDMIAERAHVRRDGDDVNGVLILFPNESTKAAYTRACQLMAQWNFTNRDKLDGWYSWPERDKMLATAQYFAGPKTDIVSKTITISPSFDYRPESAWCVEFAVGIEDGGAQAGK